jgi:WD repeat and SOF domain-containing protein 1
MPEIAKIDRQRKIPKAISKANQKKHIMLQALKKREENRRKHSKPGSVPYKAERKKHILTTEE